MKKILLSAAALCAFAAFATPAHADHWHHDGGVHIGIGLGYGYYPPGWGYYGYPGYYYPPYYVAPPPVAYVPPPAYYAAPAPAPVYAAPSSIPADQTSPTYTDERGQTCREYQSTAIVGGASQPTYGTACLQPDGSWRVVR